MTVGVDGSFYGDQALTWAAEEAAATGRPLAVVHAVDGAAAPAEADPVLTHARWLLGVLRQPGEVRYAAIPGDPARVLAAADPGLLVVGARGRRTVAALLRAGAGPLVVVRPDRSAPSGGGVLVAVDACGRCGPALDLALGHAARRGLPLTVLAVGEEPVEAPVAPGVVVRALHAPGPADEALVAASAGMDLVVLGSHIHPPLADGVVAAVDRWVLAHAACSVAVVPDSR